jgi:hypothetical protein
MPGDEKDSGNVKARMEGIESVTNRLTRAGGADILNVKVTTEDIESVNKKIQEFAASLPPGEQNVMAWLLGRAAEAPQERPEFLAEGEPVGRPVPRGPLTEALGIAQFERLEPGSAAAGSSIGVTGTIMF